MRYEDKAGLPRRYTLNDSADVATADPASEPYITQLTRMSANNFSAGIDAAQGVVQKALGFDEAANANFQEFDRLSKRARDLGPAIQSWDDVEREGVGVGTIGQYLGAQVANMVPDIAMAATGAGILGVAGRRAAMAGTRKLATEYAESQAGKAAADLATAQAEKRLLDAGVDAAKASTSARLAGREAVENAFMAGNPGVRAAVAAGQKRGIMAGGTLAGVPSALNDEETVKLAQEGDEADAWTLLGGGVAQAALDFLPLARLGGRVADATNEALKGEFTRTFGQYARDIAKQAGIQAAAEGSTEVAQEALKYASHAIVTGDPSRLYSEGAMRNYLISFATGAVIGGGMGGAVEASTPIPRTAAQVWNNTTNFFRGHIAKQADAARAAQGQPAGPQPDPNVETLHQKAEAQAAAGGRTPRGGAVGVLDNLRAKMRGGMDWFRRSEDVDVRTENAARWFNQWKNAAGNAVAPRARWLRSQFEEFDAKTADVNMAMITLLDPEYTSDMLAGDGEALYRTADLMRRKIIEGDTLNQRETMLLDDVLTNVNPAARDVYDSLVSEWRMRSTRQAELDALRAKGGDVTPGEVVADAGSLAQRDENADPAGSVEAAIDGRNQEDNVGSDRAETSMAYQPNVDTAANTREVFYSAKPDTPEYTTARDALIADLEGLERPTGRGTTYRTNTITPQMPKYEEAKTRAGVFPYKKLVEQRVGAEKAWQGKRAPTYTVAQDVYWDFAGAANGRLAQEGGTYNNSNLRDSNGAPIPPIKLAALDVLADVYATGMPVDIKPFKTVVNKTQPLEITQADINKVRAKTLRDMPRKPDQPATQASTTGGSREDVKNAVARRVAEWRNNNPGKELPPGFVEQAAADVKERLSGSGLGFEGDGSDAQGTPPLPEDGLSFGLNNKPGQVEARPRQDTVALTPQIDEETGDIYTVDPTNNARYLIGSDDRATMARNAMRAKAKATTAARLDTVTDESAGIAGVSYSGARLPKGYTNQELLNVDLKAKQFAELERLIAKYNIARDERGRPRIFAVKAYQPKSEKKILPGQPEPGEGGLVRVSINADFNTPNSEGVTLRQEVSPAAVGFPGEFKFLADPIIVGYDAFRPTTEDMRAEDEVKRALKAVNAKIDKALEIENDAAREKEMRALVQEHDKLQGELADIRDSMPAESKESRINPDKLIYDDRAQYGTTIGRLAAPDVFDRLSGDLNAALESGDEAQINEANRALNDFAIKHFERAIDNIVRRGEPLPSSASVRNQRLELDEYNGKKDPEYAYLRRQLDAFLTKPEFRALRTPRILVAAALDFDNVTQGTQVEYEYAPGKWATKKTLNEWGRSVGADANVREVPRPVVHRLDERGVSRGATELRKTLSEVKSADSISPRHADALVAWYKAAAEQTATSTTNRAEYTSVEQSEAAKELRRTLEGLADFEGMNSPLARALETLATTRETATNEVPRAGVPPVPAREFIKNTPNVQAAFADRKLPTLKLKTRQAEAVLKALNDVNVTFGTDAPLAGAVLLHPRRSGPAVERNVAAVTAESIRTPEKARETMARAVSMALDVQAEAELGAKLSDDPVFNAGSPARAAARAQNPELFPEGQSNAEFFAALGALRVADAPVDGGRATLDRPGERTEGANEQLELAEAVHRDAVSGLLAARRDRAIDANSAREAARPATRSGTESRSGGAPAADTSPPLAATQRAKNPKFAKFRGQRGVAPGAFDQQLANAEAGKAREKALEKAFNSQFQRTTDESSSPLVVERAEQLRADAEQLGASADGRTDFRQQALSDITREADAQRRAEEAASRPDPRPTDEILGEAAAERSAVQAARRPTELDFFVEDNVDNLPALREAYDRTVEARDANAAAALNAAIQRSALNAKAKARFEQRFKADFQAASTPDPRFDARSTPYNQATSPWTRRSEDDAAAASMNAQPNAHDLKAEGKYVSALLAKMGFNLGSVQVKSASAAPEAGVSEFGMAMTITPDGKIEIIAGESLTGPERLETLQHEVGHVVLFAYLAEITGKPLADFRGMSTDEVIASLKDADPKLHDALMADYEAWLAEAQKPGARKHDVLRAREGIARNAGRRARAKKAKKNQAGPEVESLDDLNRQYLLSFEEWMADGIQRAMANNKVAKSTTKSFFAKLAAKFRELYKAFAALHKKAFDNSAPPSVQEFVDKLFDSNVRRVKAATGSAMSSDAAAQLMQDAADTMEVGQAVDPAPVSLKTLEGTGVMNVVNKLMRPEDRNMVYAFLNRQNVRVAMRKALDDFGPRAGSEDAKALYDALGDAYTGQENTIALGLLLHIMKDTDGKPLLDIKALGQNGKGAERLFTLKDDLMAMVGAASDAEYVIRLFEAAEPGGRLLAEGRKFDVRFEANAARKGRDRKVDQALNAASRVYDAAAKWWGKVFGSGIHARAMESGIPALRKIASLIHPSQFHGTEDRGMIRASEYTVAKYFEAFSKAIGDADEKTIKDALQILQTKGDTAALGDDKAAQIATAVRGVLKQFYGDYAKPVLTNLGGIDQFFPVVVDIRSVEDEIALSRLIGQPKFLPHIRKFFDAKAKAAGYEKSQLSDAEMVKNLVQGAKREPGLSATISDEPLAQGARYRTMGFIYEHGSKEDIEAFAALQSKDMAYILSRYIEPMVRKVEDHRRFGGGRFERMLANAVEQGATPEDIQFAKDMRAAGLRTFGADGSPVIKMVSKRLAEKLNNRSTQNTIANLQAYQNARLLPLALLSSLADPMGIAVRSGGNMVDTVRGIKFGLSALMKNADSMAELERMVAELEVPSDFATEHNLNYALGGIEQTPMSRTVNDFVFKMNGMSAWTKATRYMALDVAHRFLLKHALEPNKHSERYFKELNLQPGDVKPVIDLRGKPTTRVAILSPEAEAKATPEEKARNLRVKKAIVDFVDQSILRPNQMQAPLWHADPYMGLVTQYQSFTYAMWDQIGKRVMHEVGEENFGVLIAALAYLPIIVMAGLLRELIQYGEEGNPNRADWGIAEYTGDAVAKTGLIAPGAAILNAAYNDVNEGRMPLASRIGPTGSQIVDGGEALAQERNFGEFVLDAGLGMPLYDKRTGVEAETEAVTTEEGETQ